MGEIVSANEFIEKMKAKELREYTAAQFAALSTLKRDNAVLQDKVRELERMLASRATIIAPCDEEIICIEQISVLKNRSSQRELSLDEVKRLDLLIKNLRLIREQSTQAIDVVDYTNMKEADLVAAINSPSEDSK